MKVERMFYVCLAVVLMALGVYGLKDNPDALEIVSFAFMGVMAAFLGVEVAVMISKTSNLPKGEWEPAHKGRYIFCLIACCLLCIETLYIESAYDLSLKTTAGYFFAAAMITIAELVGGLSANRLVQENGPEVEVDND